MGSFSIAVFFYHAAAATVPNASRHVFAALYTLSWPPTYKKGNERRVTHIGLKDCQSKLNETHLVPRHTNVELAAEVVGRSPFLAVRLSMFSTANIRLWAAKCPFDAPTPFNTLAEEQSFFDHARFAPLTIQLSSE